MPRLSKSNANPVVGTFHCDTCNSEASVLEIQRSRRRGLLYVRCGCGCDQRTGAQIQAHWRQIMTVREGYEYAKRGEAPPVQEPKRTDNWEPGEPKPDRGGDGSVTEQGSVQVTENEPNQVQSESEAARQRLRKAIGGLR